MAIHPRLEGEFWGPTIDLLLDENIKVVFTCFNKDHYDEMLDRLDYVFVKYIYKVNNERKYMGLIINKSIIFRVLTPGCLVTQNKVPWIPT